MVSDGLPNLSKERAFATPSPSTERCGFDVQEIGCLKLIEQLRRWRLPKTRSGKILRGTMRKIADSETYRAPATIDDPAILNEIRAALVELGYAK